MDKFNKRVMVDDFIDDQGIVVDFPGDIDDELVALVNFAKTVLADAEQAEAENARLRAALEFYSDENNYDEYIDPDYQWSGKSKRYPAEIDADKGAIAREALGAQP